MEFRAAHEPALVEPALVEPALLHGAALTGLATTAAVAAFAGAHQLIFGWNSDHAWPGYLATAPLAAVGLAGYVRTRAGDGRPRGGPRPHVRISRT